MEPKTSEVVRRYAAREAISEDEALRRLVAYGDLMVRAWAAGGEVLVRNSRGGVRRIEPGQIGR